MKANQASKQKLKILAAGDIHGDTSLVKKLADRAKKEKVDLVVLTGDLTFAETSVDNLVGPFVKAKKEVLLIPGNHESLATANFLADRYKGVKNIHGTGIKEKDVGIFGVGSANIGIFQIKDDEMYNLLKKGWQKVKTSKKKIMITHCHPAGTKMEKFTHFFKGSKGITKAIKTLKPDLALCSHIHEAEGIEEKLGKTKVINVGRKGNIIEI